nr:venom protein [Lampona murina]
MHRLFLLTSFFSSLTFEQVTVDVDNCGISKVAEERIIGGAQAGVGEFPWMASLYFVGDNNKLYFKCGATVLNERWVITAATCTGRSPSNYEILVGLHNQMEKNASSVQRLKVSKIVVHEDYDRIYHNDIALLKTATPIDIAGSMGYVNGICLPEVNEEPTGKAIVLGWGMTQAHKSQFGGHSDILKEVEVPLIDIDTCNKIYDPDNTRDTILRLDEHMICAGAENAYACFWDEGGPLFQIKGGAATLIGVLALGGYCGDHGYPGFYTKVSSYVDWIERVLYEAIYD